MLRTLLKSKIHLARVTDANLNYEGSITIARDLMKTVDLWPGEQVLVVCRDSGERLWTYAQPGPPASGAVVINGPAARKIGRDDRITIMAFGQSEKAIEARKITCNDQNEIVRTERGVQQVTLPLETVAF